MTLPERSRPIPIPSTKVRIASSIAWLAGSYSIVVAASIGLLELSAHGGFPVLFAVNGLLGSLCCLTGYLLRKRSRLGGILAVALCLLAGFGAWRGGGLLTITFVLTGIGLVMVLMSWGELNAKA